MATYLFLPGCYRPTIETQRWGKGGYELPRGRKYESEHGTRGGSLPPPTRSGSPLALTGTLQALMTIWSEMDEASPLCSVFSCHLDTPRTDSTVGLIGGGEGKKNQNLLLLCFLMEFIARVMGFYCALAGPYNLLSVHRRDKSQPRKIILRYNC